jgi:very-short-patch-repair endonuclease
LTRPLPSLRDTLSHKWERGQKHAKQLRGSQTDAESELWFHLGAHRFMGLKFKRQKPVGPYIVDFICIEHGVVIELDGGQHNDIQKDYDPVRDRYLVSLGLKVFRFWNDEILKDTNAVLEKLRVVLVPLPLVGEGGPKGRERVSQP